MDLLGNLVRFCIIWTKWREGDDAISVDSLVTFVFQGRRTEEYIKIQDKQFPIDETSALNLVQRCDDDEEL